MVREADEAARRQREIYNLQRLAGHWMPLPLQPSFAHVLVERRAVAGPAVRVPKQRSAGDDTDHASILLPDTVGVHESPRQRDLGRDHPRRVDEGLAWQIFPRAVPGVVRVRVPAAARLVAPVDEPRLVGAGPVEHDAVIVPHLALRLARARRADGPQQLLQR